MLFGSGGTGGGLLPCLSIHQPFRGGSGGIGGGIDIEDLGEGALRSAPTHFFIHHPSSIIHQGPEDPTPGRSACALPRTALPTAILAPQVQ